MICDIFFVQRFFFCSLTTRRGVSSRILLLIAA